MVLNWLMPGAHKAWWQFDSREVPIVAGLVEKFPDHFLDQVPDSPVAAEDLSKARASEVPILKSNSST
jgi:hypothetical protein